MSEQKKYLFIESGSKYPYICSNSEDVWNYITSTNILTTSGYENDDRTGRWIAFVDLYIAKDNISPHGILQEIMGILDTALKILGCEVVLIRQSTSEFEFWCNIRKYLNGK